MIRVFDQLALSPSAFHCVKTSADILLKAGYTQIYKSDDWKSMVKPVGKYMMIRSKSTNHRQIAQEVGHDTDTLNFKIVCQNTDSPVLKLRPNTKHGPSWNLHHLAVSPQDGGLQNTWFDRDLTIVGKVVYKKRGQNQNSTRPHRQAHSCTPQFVYTPEGSLEQGFHKIQP